MDATSYCDVLARRLSGWKALLNGITQGSEQAPGSKSERGPLLSAAELHSVINEIDAQLEELETACPAEWSAGRRAGEGGIHDLKVTLRKLSEEAHGRLIPDSLSWVSG
jgi:hypothetical protein